MSKINDAVNEFQNFNRMFKSIKAIGDFLEGVGKLEQLEREANAAKDKAVQEAVEAKAETAKAVEALKAAKQKVKDADSRAEALLKEGEANKFLIEAKGKEAAEKIVFNASNELKTLQASIAKYHAQVKAFDGLIAEKQAELDAVNKKVEDAKARIAKIMGA